MEQPTPSRYSFVSYRPEWPAMFRTEAGRLGALFGDNLIQVHHIGSTSVPGLAAKPVIDLLPVVRDHARTDGLMPAFEDAGYRVWGECGLPGRRYFSKDESGVRTHNIHAYALGDPDITRHLAFRDYLRAHVRERDAYARVKRDAYDRFPADIKGYMQAKNDWVKRGEAAALRWRADNSD